MRTHVLTAALLVVLPLAAGCARARAATTSSAAATSAAVLGVAGSCAANAGSMQPGGAGTAADLNGDGYVCVRSVAGETVRVTVDNDAASAASAAVEANLYRRM